MDSSHQFLPTDSKSSQASSPWTEWSTEFADRHGSVILPVQMTPPADGQAAHTQPDDAGDDALMDCYNG